MASRPGHIGCEPLPVKVKVQDGDAPPDPGCNTTRPWACSIDVTGAYFYVPVMSKVPQGQLGEHSFAVCLCPSGVGSFSLRLHQRGEGTGDHPQVAGSQDPCHLDEWLVLAQDSVLPGACSMCVS